MTRARTAILGVVILAVLARLVALSQHPAIHPDAFFQYLEPAWWHARGYGHPTWEWRVGLRSWLVPGYYGTWIELLSFFGVENGRTLQRFFAIHWCVSGGLLVLGAYRLAYACAHPSRAAFTWRGALDERAHHAGLVAGLLTAISPTLAYFGGQTLVETPSTLLFVFGFAYYAEAIGTEDERSMFRRACAAGVLLCLGACIRLSYAPLALLVGLVALVSRRFRIVLALLVGAIPVALLFGALDRVTWGGWFHSVVEYVKYNFIEGRAAEHGVEPAMFYVDTILDRAGIALALSVPVVLLHARRSLPTFLLSALMIAYLSTQPHKEERFMILFWPLWAVATGIGFSAAYADGQKKTRTRALHAVAAVLVLCLLVQGTRSHIAGPVYDFTELHGMYEGQAYVGAQPDSTGVLLGGRHHLNGGSMATGKNIPYAGVGYGEMGQPLFNYAVVAETGPEHEVLVQMGFRPVRAFGTHVVMRR